MLLARHFSQEYSGKQTFFARAFKRVARKAYYREMAGFFNKETAERLEKTDRAVKEAALLCPHNAKRAFRSFLDVPDCRQVVERIRLLHEIIFQLRAQKFEAYAEAPGDMLSDCLESLDKIIHTRRGEDLEQRHAWVTYKTARIHLEMKILPWTFDPDLATGFPGPLYAQSLLSNLKPVVRNVTLCNSMDIYLSDRMPRITGDWDMEVKRLSSIRMRIASMVA